MCVIQMLYEWTICWLWTLGDVTGLENCIEVIMCVRTR
jgi:hypothetical protein